MSAQTIEEATNPFLRMSPEQRQRFIHLAMPRIVEPYMAQVPTPKQQLFLALRNREVMFGGAAGPGKSSGLLLSALQYVDVPGYSALLIRRTWPDLSLPGAIMDRCREWLADTDARPREGGRQWVFPSGARIQFAHIQYHKDVHSHQSAEYTFIGWDELTQFEEQTYHYMFSRLRKPTIPCLNCKTPIRQYSSGWKHTTQQGRRRCASVFPDPTIMKRFGPAPDGTTIFDVPLRVRSATNPGNIGHEWVFNRFINPETRDRSALFIPGLLRDNPFIDQAEYEESLNHLLPLDRERLLNGDWNVSQEGTFFNRYDLTPVPQAPAGLRKVRFWDMAATDSDGDYTVGALLGTLDDGKWFIIDIVRGQWGPTDAERVVQQTAYSDGNRIPIRMEQEPGSAGKTVISHYRRNILQGFDFDGVRSTGDKQSRAKPLASAAKAQNVYMVGAQWNRELLDEFSLFPNGAHDDIVDAVSGALEALAFGRRARLIV